MPKQKKLPERPKPPTMQEIHEDIDMAPNDDVVFAVHDSENCHPFDNSVAMEESYQDASPENDRSEMGQSSAKQDSEKELVYKKTLRLIELHKKLQESPALLQEQFDHLQNLEKGVSESITELKDASDSFCVKS